MSSKTLGLSDELSAYLRQVSLRDSDLLARLREETRGMPMAGMQVSAEQGQFMQWLVRALDIRRAIEIGEMTEGAFAAYEPYTRTNLPVSGSTVTLNIDEANYRLVWLEDITGALDRRQAGQQK